MDIRGSDNESRAWSSRSMNLYRLGYEGCADLRYIEKATAGTCYKEYLQILTQPVMTVSSESGASTQYANVTSTSLSPYHLTFNVRDKVKVMLDVETLKEMEADHGVWNPRMVEYVGKVGTVPRITDKGDTRGLQQSLDFHSRALTKVTSKKTFTLGKRRRKTQRSVRWKKTTPQVTAHQGDHELCVMLMNGRSCLRASMKTAILLFIMQCSGLGFKMPRPCAVPVDKAVTVIKQFIEHFQTNKLPSWSDPRLTANQ
ncbi:E3 ubiquitin-protein ligase MIB2-like [Venturia canescens]|uniref:E3 ubiquitin-protein ligase MIB2-like n=1 Tax=Venturia canescens TaxID=32260 RepID=UPI001C9C7CEB|nr:E3 ubiquitin-protein ligase MIB2-like [Venturia canescens]